MLFSTEVYTFEARINSRSSIRSLPVVRSRNRLVYCFADSAKLSDLSALTRAQLERRYSTTSLFDALRPTCYLGMAFASLHEKTLSPQECKILGI